MNDIETFEEFCKNNDCSTCRFEKIAIDTGCSNCEKHFMKEHDAKVRADAIEFISDKLIYSLLDECDRGLWEHINHIELAKEWIKVLDDNPYPKIKNHTEARKRDLRQWIAEQLKDSK